MANQRHHPKSKTSGATTGHKVPKKDSLNESCPDFPGLPGKEGPDRSNGVEKAKTHPQQKGL